MKFLMVNHKYDGYMASFISVKYLIKTLNHNELLSVIKDKKLIYKIGENVLNDAVRYYNDGKRS